MHYRLSSTRMMMSTLATTAFVLFLTHGALASENAKGKTIINVSIYYETLCGDSVRFVMNQLRPSYKNLQDHLKLDFVPYGKATHRWDEKTGRWVFGCQHGPAECEGNRAQACALDAIKKTEKDKDHQRLSVDLVSCVMNSTYPSTAVTSCGESKGLSKATKETIAACEKSTLSDDLLVAHGDNTHSLHPPLSFVPTIVINKVFSRENQAAALSDFQTLICGMIPQNEKPAVCPIS